MTKEERLQVIQDIKMLINSCDEELVEINPKLLEYFIDEELLQLKNDLITKKSHFFENNADWLDEIYKKTKKDEI